MKKECIKFVGELIIRIMKFHAEYYNINRKVEIIPKLDDGDEDSDDFYLNIQFRFLEGDSVYTDRMTVNFNEKFFNKDEALEEFDNIIAKAVFLFK